MDYTSNMPLGNYIINPHLVHPSHYPSSGPMPYMGYDPSSPAYVSGYPPHPQPAQRTFSYPGTYRFADVPTPHGSFAIIKVPYDIMRTAYPTRVVEEFAHCINRPAVLYCEPKNMIYGPPECIEYIKRPLINLRWFREIFP
jgi:hypothetical protein